MRGTPSSEVALDVSDLRERIQARPGRPAILLGVHNPMTAALVQAAGFSGGWLSSLEISTIYGLADRNVISVDLVGTVVSAIRSRVSLPLFVDADNGYGSPLAAARASRLLSSAGAAGMSIEDSLYPKVNSFSDGSSGLESVEAYCEKLAAIRGSAGRDFLVIARTEALIRGHGIAAALDRAAAYEEAGADLVLIHSREPTGAEAMAVAAAWQGAAPLVSVPTAFPHIAASDLCEAGYSMVIYANPLLRASIWSTQRALQLVASGHPEHIDTEFGQMAELVAFNDSFADVAPLPVRAGEDDGTDR